MKTTRCPHQYLSKYTTHSTKAETVVMSIFSNVTSSKKRPHPPSAVSELPKHPHVPLINNLCAVFQCGHGRQSVRNKGDMSHKVSGGGTPVTFSPKWRNDDLELLRAFPFSQSSNPLYLHDYIIRSSIRIVDCLKVNKNAFLSSEKSFLQAKNALKSCVAYYTLPRIPSRLGRPHRNRRSTPQSWI